MPKVRRQQWKREAQTASNENALRTTTLRNSLKTTILVLFMLLVVLALTPTVDAESSSNQYYGPPERDILFHFMRDDGGAPSGINIRLARVSQSLAVFGDLDHAVQITHNDIAAPFNCAGAGAGIERTDDHLDCGFDGGNGFVIVWRHNSTLQATGTNWSLEIQWSVGLANDRFFAGAVRFFNATDESKDPSVANLAIHNATMGTQHAAHNDTMLAQHTSHDANSTGHNDTMTSQHAAQDLTHPTPGGCDAGCVGNITQNVTQNFTRFSTDCHGTGLNLCINGHEPNLLDQTALRHVFVVGLYLVLVFAGFQGGYGLSFGSGILSLFIMMFLFNPSNHGFMGDAATTIIAGMLFLLPLAIGFWNGGTEYRQRNRAEDAMQ